MISPLLALDHPDAPKYWMYETGGLLRVAVEKYLYRRPLTISDIALLRAYLSQWILSPVWDMNPSADDGSREELRKLRAGVQAIKTAKDIRVWLRDALNAGHDPL